MSERFKLAAIQAAPVLFDKTASLEKACSLIAQAAARGADLAGFGETWLPGYPFFVDGPTNQLLWEASAEYLANAIPIPGPETDRLCATAREHGIDVAIGVAELDPYTAGTAYCTLLFIGREGKILGRHRKLKPTHAERLVWGDGDAVGLVAHQRPYGRISGLNCWEHQMMLPGYALVAQGTQIHVAAWPGRMGDAPPGEYCWTRQVFLSRAYAAQASAYVICAAGMRLSKDIPDKYRPLGEWEHNGGACIIDPRGEIIAGPMDGSVEGEGILIAEGDLDTVRRAKSATDIAGHYSRPDIFELRVNRAPLPPLITESS